MTLVDAETLAILVKQINDRVKHEGDCLISLRSRNVISYDKIAYYIPRIIWSFHGRAEIPSKYIFQPTCGNNQCITLNHLRFVSRSNPINKEEIKALMQLRSQVTADGKCIILNCGPNYYGYGLWTISGKQHLLQRVIIWLYGHWERIEDLPSNMQAGHLCRNLCCINPDHYELVSPTVNNYEHKIRDGTLIRGESSNFARIKEETAKEIIATWRPKGHVEYMTSKERAEKFNVSPGHVSAIDCRVVWKHLQHPNALPIPRWRKRKTEACLRLSTQDLFNIKEKLRKHSSVGDVLNVFTGSPCWLWNTMTKNKPSMSYNGIDRLASIHACYINGPKPFENAVARHKCGVSRCVNFDHLEWGSRKENAADRRIHGTNGRKLTLDNAREIRKSIKCNADLAKEYGVRKEMISKIRLGQRWKEDPATNL